MSNFHSERSISEEYREAIQPYRRLTPEVQWYLVMRYRDYDDIEARNQLVNSYLRLVVWIAMKYRDRADIDDLIQAGNVGMLSAIEKAKPGRGSLDAYVGKWITGAIRNLLKAQRRHTTISYSHTCVPGVAGKTIPGELVEREDADELSRAVAIAISRLKPRSQSIVLQSMSGCGQKEIAASHGLSVPTVSTLIRWARVRLQVFLQAYGRDNGYTNRALVGRIKVRCRPSCRSRNFYSEWVDPIDGAVKARSTRTSDRNEAERISLQLERELNGEQVESLKEQAVC